MPPQPAFVVPAYFDLAATLLWAISGALLAARRGYAILGVVTVAIVSSTGGGLLRDSIFVQTGVPVVLRTPVYLELIGLAVVFVAVAGVPISRWRYFDRLLVLVDAVGFGAYAVVGMGKALAVGLPLPSVVLVGMVNSVGGGVLRDVLMTQEVNLFKPGTIEQVNALIGCFIFLFMLRWLEIDLVVCAWTTIICVFVFRMLAIRFDIQSRPLLVYTRERQGNPDEEETP